MNQQSTLIAKKRRRGRGENASVMFFCRATQMTHPQYIIVHTLLQPPTDITQGYKQVKQKLNIELGTLTSENLYHLPQEGERGQRK